MGKVMIMSTKKRKSQGEKRYLKIESMYENANNDYPTYYAVGLTFTSPQHWILSRRT
jgi:hypothetical protein